MKLPFIVSIPHCSYRIPAALMPILALTAEETFDSTDIGTGEIFSPIPARVSLSARWSRLVVDLNRDPDQRDRNGVIAQVDYYGRTIYREGCFPNEKEIDRRLREYYRPFHKKLNQALQRTDIKALFDCHSLDATGPAEAPDAGKQRKDIILGNNGDQEGNTNPHRGQITCPPDTLHVMKGIFEKAGFSVSINKPYAGGFITRQYGQALVHQGRITIQIEINQGLYLEPNGCRPMPEKLERVKIRMEQVFKEMAARL